MKIYVAGPYSSEDPAEVEKNVQTAIAAGLSIYHLGHFPYIPHLTHYVDIHSKQKNIKMEWNDYLRWDLVWLNQCEGLLFLGKSPGANMELEEAIKNKKIIFYNLSEIPNNTPQKKSD